MVESLSHSPGIAKHRIEALSDGIYAIALTLLVLELRLPGGAPHADDQALRGMLLELLPKGLAWLVSFWVIALFWLAQQRAYRLCQHLDSALLRIELTQLSLISLFPFSNALMGEHGSLVTAAAVYSAHLLAIALLSWLRIAHVARHAELHAPEMLPALVQALRLRAAMACGCALAALLLAFAFPAWNMLAMLPTLLLPGLARR
jgi:uncharacterized membrane protein